MKFCPPFSLVLKVFERGFLQKISHTLFLYKNIVHKNIQANNHPIFKNIKRILLRILLLGGF